MSRLELHVAENPALQRILLELRDEHTEPWRFRELLRLAGILLGYEAARFLPSRRDTVRTPLGATASAVRVADEELVVVAVLRAAAPMAMGLLELYPRAVLGFAAATRLEDTGRQQEGRLVFDVEVPYWRVPPVKDKTVIAVDPMLATGSTLSRIVARLEREGAKRIVVVSLIATREGLETLREAVKGEIAVVVGAVDPELNEKGFIVPGLGDAGDRSFGEA
ncbi:uracil phosphoribosyltransferase [Hyperthermus butylicus]|uniref:Uracil phosphoribosyltransferase n=1 Tax=Hyperthermus butylicus (strain DSM 5456 / JCM 9403 / PLM1-5) TaxID=415426 RepID=A2BLJ7_HYPBU|nr:uracil phosphoribosyltransferase [Hyperthermus butylicus]ABM80858.1 Uracil phosphoribosyltransferase [Hyperthermus butylicus DSM 5456]